MAEELQVRLVDHSSELVEEYGLQTLFTAMGKETKRLELLLKCTKAQEKIQRLVGSEDSVLADALKITSYHKDDEAYPRFHYVNFVFEGCAARFSSRMSESHGDIDCEYDGKDYSIITMQCEEMEELGLKIFRDLGCYNIPVATLVEIIEFVGENLFGSIVEQMGGPENLSATVPPRRGKSARSTVRNPPPKRRKR